MIGFDANSLDDVIHGRVRLAVMAFLSGAGEAEFTLLANKIEVTNGNLSIHLGKLKSAGYVKIRKRFIRRRPQTRIAITEAGRSAFALYLEKVGDLIKATRRDAPNT